MKERQSAPLAVVLLLLATGLSLLGTHSYISGYVRIGGVTYSRELTELDLSGAPVEDLETLEELTQLQKLDLRGTGLTPEEYDALQSQLPGCEILWDVPFQGSYLDCGKKVLTITSLTAEDAAMLEYLPQLELVTAYGCTDYQELMALIQRRPDLTVHYDVEIAGKTYSHRTADLTVPGDDPEELARLFSYLPNLRTVTLVEPLADVESLRALQAAFPEVNIAWQLDFGGVLADETTTTLDLTGIPMTVEAIESKLPYMPNLTYVDMSHCGISNEEMDALNRRYEDIKFVWTVSIGRYLQVKTDITWFMPVKYGVYVRTADVYNLRYCTDVICLDIGHMNVSNCDFVAYMPHLKYLLLADTEISDITPLTGLTELVYLELFLTHVTDYSPLLTLTALEDLNLHYTRGDPEIIAQMTWLKNLWWGHNDTYRISWNTQQMLREALPNTHCEFMTTSSTGAGWRQLPNYYAQRDILGMRYMD